MKYSRYPSYKDSGVEWLGEIPSEWDITRLGNLGMLTASGIDKKLKEDEPFVNIINFTDVHKATNAKLTNETTYMKVTAPIEKKIAHQVAVGDLIFTPSSETIEDIGISALVDEALDNTAFSYHVLRFNFTKPINHNYRKYISNNTFTLAQFSMKARGTTRQTLGRDDFKTINLALPPLQEQQIIANYLDKATAKIDILIAKQTKLIELLKEKRHAVISTAVTRGLDSTVAMKDSGIEWLGEIPEHWEVQRGKFIFEEKNRPVRDIDGIVTVFRDGQVVLRSKRRSTGFTMAILEHGYQGIREGDLVIHSMDAFAGAIGVSEDDGRSTPEYVVVKPYTNSQDEEYYANQLRLMAQRGFIYILCPSVRERAPRYRFARFSETSLVSPPYEEQLLITQYIEQSSTNIDNLVSKAERFIKLLKEKRIAIISSAVTGKIDVRGER